MPETFTSITAPPLRVRHVAQKPGVRYARAERQRIDAVIQREHVAAHRLHAPAVGQIAEDRVRVVPLRAETVGQRLGLPKPAAAVNQNRVALPRQLFGARAADAAGCAGDERDFFLHMQNLRGFPYCLSA